MMPLSSSREALFHQIIEYAAICDEIRGLAVVGSSARTQQPADQWSDIDLILVARCPDQFLHSSGWLRQIAEPWMVTVERDPRGKVIEKRVLFRNGVDVDFIVLSPDDMQALSCDPLMEITQRGVCVRVDKDALFQPFLIDPQPAVPFRPPTEPEFTELVNDFWFHTVWTAKKLKRGELWTAKSCCDHYMKQLLITMIEWFTLSQAGWDGETWYRGRFIEQWAAPEIVEHLGSTYAHYSEPDIWRALFSTIHLFDAIARETSKRIAIPYPDMEAKQIQDWIDQLTP